MRNDIYVSYLRHHGILGQKWGKRNGPPYPLGASDHSAREKKAGWRKSLDKTSPAKHTKSKPRKDPEPDTKEKKGLTDKQKKAIKIGVAFAATALVTYGTYRLVKSGKLDKQIAAGKAYVDELLGKKTGDVLGNSILSDKIKRLSSETGFKLHSKIPSITESCRLANPDYDRNNPAYAYNCGKSVVADIMNSLGVNVKAKGLFAYEQKAKGLSWNEVLSPFKGAYPKDYVVPKASSLSGNMCKDSVSKRLLEYAGGKDAIGIFKMNKAGTNYGHYMKWQIKNGIVAFSNSQTGKMDVDNWFNGMAKGLLSREISFERLDNLDIDDLLIENFVTKI